MHFAYKLRSACTRLTAYDLYYNLVLVKNALTYDFCNFNVNKLQLFTFYFFQNHFTKNKSQSDIVLVSYRISLASTSTPIESNFFCLPPKV